MSVTTPWMQIAEQMATAIAEVTNAGVVHTRQRYIKEWSTFLDQFATEVDGVRIIRGWQIVPERPYESTIESLGPAPVFSDSLRFMIRGVNGADDSESYEDFLTVAYEVKRKLDITQDFSLAGISDVEIVRAYPCDIVGYNMRVFGAIACWTAELVRVVEVLRTETMEVS